MMPEFRGTALDLHSSAFAFQAARSQSQPVSVCLSDLSGKGIGKALMSKVAQVSMHT